MPEEISQPPFEHNELDISSDPPMASGQAEARQSNQQELGQDSVRPVRLYFGCCRVYAQMLPPEHVLQGRSDIWRVHCPRCGGLIEILFQ